MGSLEGKVAIITGASSGIGEATAERFINEGAKVSLAARSEDLGQEVAHRLGENAIFVKCDVTSSGDLDNLIQQSMEKWGQLDCLFNNAGSGLAVFSVDEITDEAIDSQFTTLVRSVMMATKLAAPHLKENGGTIINNASVSAHGGMYAPIIYSAAKAAVVNFTQWTALDLASSNIRVNSISPGPVYTAIFHRAFGIPDEEGEKKASEVREALGNGIPLGRPGEVAEIASIAAFLASDDSSLITGQDIGANGGILAGWNRETMLDVYGGIMDVFGIPRPE